MSALEEQIAVTEEAEATTARARVRARSGDSRPKRPLSAFALFTRDARADVRRLMPDAPLTDVLKVIGKRWKEAPDTTRARYEKLAHEQAPAQDAAAAAAAASALQAQVEHAYAAAEDARRQRDDIQAASRASMDAFAAENDELRSQVDSLLAKLRNACRGC
ncbi:uncharacterized protein AMSG_03219 [Thecamonas trahens ATCC 50062]|uniref:HMG box domain-containing protein n=1 Tax=Thecamonas trahens ATCC 50062 TaxID=461836 RepID=A0A0L0D3A3_THETB|nr:hypothetical protein AMSG_03219 [Thecamonas trahens ATCC 50062]KNC46789.1 hypothetical protein AMSG_03219 [Thecamonas trahens ATCC 50062]|eukprot:XP_013760064.1 hypothetical protein AMSG_03219 [Thecamonas trahens ATCC 50062]